MRNLHLLKVLGTFTAPKLFSAYKPLLYQGFSPFNYIMPPIDQSLSRTYIPIHLGNLIFVFSLDFPHITH